MDTFTLIIIGVRTAIINHIDILTNSINQKKIIKTFKTNSGIIKRILFTTNNDIIQFQTLTESFIEIIISCTSITEMSLILNIAIFELNLEQKINTINFWEIF